MDHLPGVNSEKIIGWVGGMDIPVLHDFLVGYKQGAAYIDPEIQVLVAFAGSFSDPVRGKELTLSQYEQGADVVMNVASGTGNGILEAAYEEGKYAIGVDLDQDGIYPGSIVTSMLKRVDQAAYLMVQKVVDGTWQGGEVLYMDIANGGVSLTDMSVMRGVLGDDFPMEILDKVAELIQAAVQAGANDLRGVTFQVKNADKLLEDALKLAVADAKAKAQLVADELGARVVRVHSVSVQDQGASVVKARAGLNMDGVAAEAAPVPVFAGTSTFSATVSVTFELQ